MTHLKTHKIDIPEMLKQIKTKIWRNSYEYQVIPMNDIEMIESLESSVVLEDRNKRQSIPLQTRIDIINQSRYKDECGIQGYISIAVVCCIIILFICIQIYRTRP